MVYARVKSGTEMVRMPGESLYPGVQIFKKFNDIHYEKLKADERLEVFTQEEMDRFLADIDSQAKALGTAQWKKVEVAVQSIIDIELLEKAREAAIEANQTKNVQLIDDRLVELKG